MNNVYIRQSGIVSQDKLRFPIFIAGVGSSGSWTALGLTKMGCTDVVVADFDIVESHNTTSQVYGPKHIGQLKVQALQSIINYLTNTSLLEFQGIKAEDSRDLLCSEVVVLALDSLSARKKVFDTLKGSSIWKLLIDVRMAGELIRIFVVRSDDVNSVEDYEKTLSSQQETHQESCDARSIVYNSLACSFLVCKHIKDYANGELASQKYNFDLGILNFF